MKVRSTAKNQASGDAAILVEPFSFLSLGFICETKRARDAGQLQVDTESR